MRCAVLSDIHANQPALEAVLTDLRGLEVDCILLAGDLISGGPYPCETLARIQDLQRGPLPVHAIRGNNEAYLLDLQRGTCHPSLFTSRQWGITSWAWRELGEAGMDWVSGLPVQLSLDGLRLVHGSPANDRKGLIPDRDPVAMARFHRAHLLGPSQTTTPLSTVLAEIDENILVCGHTHIAWQQCDDGKLALNPGSVGAPINGDPRAQYAILDFDDGLNTARQVEFRAVAYEIRTVQAAIEERGLLEAGGGIARAVQLDYERADNTVWKFVLHCQAHARAAGIAEGAVLPDEIYLEAERTFF